MSLPLPIPGPRVVGIDLSLASTGIGIIDDYQGYVHRITTGKLRGHARLKMIAGEVVRHCKGADLVVIEGPAYNAKQGAFDMGGCWWTVTHYLWRNGISVVSVQPSQLKKYATGTGAGPNSSKDRVLAAAIRRYPGVDITGNDEADAFVLAAMGADWLGHPIAKVPEACRAAVESVKGWPGAVPTGNGKPAFN